MKVAVSGADGFLGSHILNVLCALRECEIVGISVNPDSLSEVADWANLEVVRADLHSMACDERLDEVDVYLACAFPRSATGSEMADGLDFVFNSLSVMLDRDCKAIVNISSQSVYDPHRVSPAKETDSLVLSSPYAVAKYCVERTVESLCKERGTSFYNVRMASLIGPGFDQRFVNKMAHYALDYGMVAYMKGESRHAFLDVEDAAQGIVTLLRAFTCVPNGTVNLGPSSGYTVERIARTVACEMANLTGTRIALEVSGVEGDTTNSEMDCSKLESLLGWTPSISLEESVAAICSTMTRKANG